MFMVEVELKDMPANSTTFIRQRTFSETSDSNNNNNEKTMGQMTPLNARTSTKLATRLRFLIHLR
jgi:hypothetical protein